MSLFRPQRRVSAGRGVEARGFTVGNVGSSTLGDSMSSALALAPLYSAATLIVDAVSTVPVRAYLDERAGRIPTNPQPPVALDPGIGLPRSAWIGQALMSLLLRGNAFGLVLEMSPLALPLKVRWLNPDSVTVDESGPLPRFSVAGRPIPRELMVHIPGHVLPGSCVGLSPLGLFRTQVQTGRRVDEATSAWYGQAANPRGILANKAEKLTPEQVQTTKDRYKAMMSDHDILVTGSDWSWTPLAVAPVDAEFAAAARMSANQIAAIYHVPPEEIGGEAGGSLTYSTVELNGVKFNRRAVLPWTSRLQTAWSAMLPASDFVEFDLAAAAQPELKTRTDVFGALFRSGVTAETAARTAGLPDLEFTGAVPITLRQPESKATVLEDT